MYVIQILIFLINFYCDSANDVSIKFENITIIGRKLYTIFENKPYVAFWDIPYALPPVGALRFKLPKYYHLSNTTYDFTTIKVRTCNEIENCLYLAVYMPILRDQSLQMPVVVWIENQYGKYEPDFLLDEDIVIVTVSYRTSIFGFLNTEDDFAEGNMGAKDVIRALKFIKNKIAYFNGDPNRVTVLGVNRAAVVVSSLILSTAAEDLFSRVIIQSGSALSPADYRNYNFDVANKLYWNLHGPFEKLNRTRLYEILRHVSAPVLLTASQDLFDSTEVRDNQRLINTFGPTVETSKNAFMNKSPLDVYQRKFTNNNVQVMIGYTNLESLHKLRGFAENKKLLKYLNYNFQYLLPFEGTKDEYDSKRYRQIKKRIMEFYFVNGTIGEGSLRRYAKYVSDQVIYPLLRQARLQAAVSCSSVYLYRFPFKGAFNIAWNSSVPNLDWYGATSGDEICYLFKCKSVNDVYNSAGVSNERHFIKKIARLLANFAKCGNPTPARNDNLLGNLKWTPLREPVIKGLNLGRKIKMIDVPEQKRMDFWDELKSVFFTETPRDEL